jgi:Mg-chelatase subunit ChlD
VSPRLLLRLACALGLVVAAWLFLPRPASGGERAAPLRVLVVDASASVTRTRPDWLPWARRLLREEGLTAARVGEEVAVVSFASSVGVTFAPGPAAELLDRLEGRAGAPLDPRQAAGAEDETRLARALEVASGLVLAPGRHVGAVVVLGAERSTGVDPRAVLARLARAGVRIEHHPPPPPSLPELGVSRLVLAPEVEAGAPLLASAELVYTAGGEGRSEAPRAWLEVEIENVGTVQRRRVPLDLPPLGGRFEVPVACGPAGFGRTEVRATSRLDPGPDPTPENDRRSASTVAEGELVVLVAAEEDRLAEARAWLAPSGASALAGIQFLFATPAELPRLLDQADALVTYDLTPRALPELFVEAFVQAGGGWLATSGWRFLDDWVPGQAQEGLHRLLPAEPAPLEHGPRDVVLLVDGSGSMEGEPFDTVRTACLDLVAAALPSDEVRLRFFTARLQAATLIKRRTADADEDVRSGAEAARRLLALHVPSGETHILLSLEDYLAERRGAEREALALLLTDGLEREAMPDPAGRAAALRAGLGEERTTLRPIAIGRDASLEFLGFLTGPGEEVLVPEGLDDLRAIFRREISGAQVREEEALALRWAHPAPGLADPLVARLRGAGAEELPALSRLVKNRVRASAEALWVADEGEPVLAAQRVGLGRTALLATLPAAGWAPEWTGRAGIGEPARFGNLLRWLGRGPGRRADGPRARLRGEELLLTGLDRSWPAEVVAAFLDGAARDAAVDRELRLLPPTALASGVAGDPLASRVSGLDPDRLRALRELPGDPVLRVEGPRGPVLLALERGPRAEFDGSGLPWTDPLPPGPADGRDSARGAPGAASHPLAPWIAGAALLALFGSCLGRGRRAGNRQAFRAS